MTSSGLEMPPYQNVSQMRSIWLRIPPVSIGIKRGKNSDYNPNCLQDEARFLFVTETEQVRRRTILRGSCRALYCSRLRLPTQNFRRPLSCQEGRRALQSNQ